MFKISTLIESMGLRSVIQDAVVSVPNARGLRNRFSPSPLCSRYFNKTGRFVFSSK
jgi:hypothetical protein